MTAYRLVLLITIVAAVLVAASVPLLSATDSAAFLSWMILIVAGGDVVSTLYIGSLVRADRRKPRSWLLLMLFTTSAIVTIGFVSIGYIVARRFLGLPPLPNSVGLLITGMSVMLIGSVPITKALLFFLVAHDPSARDKTDGLR